MITYFFRSTLIIISTLLVPIDISAQSDPSCAPPGNIQNRNQCNIDNPTLALVSTGNNIACEGDTVKIEVDIDQSLAFDYYVYYWCDGTIDTAGTVGSHVYNITLEDDEACDFGETSFFVQVLGVKNCGEDTFTSRTTGTSQGIKYKPRARFSSDNQVCITDGVQFTNLSCFGDEYRWEFGDGETSSEENPLHFYEAPDRYQVKLTAINDCDSSVIFRTVEVVSAPIADFSVSPNTPDELCGNPIVTLTNQSSNNSFIEWTIEPNDTTKWRFADTTFTRFSDVLEINFLEPIDYIVTITANNACPADEQIDTIRINQSPIIRLTSPPIACDSLVLNASDILRQANGTIDEYIWTFENADTERIENEDFSNVVFRQSGSVTLTAVSPCGDSTKSIPIIVASTESIQFTTLPNQTICQNDTTFRFQATPSSGLWEGIGEANGAIRSDGRLDPNLLPSGQYSVRYKAGSEECPNEATIDFFVVEPVSVTLENINANCDSLSLNTAEITTYSGDIDTYTWRYDDITLDEAFPTITFGVGSYSLIAEVSGNCGTFMDTILIEVQQSIPNLSIQAIDQAICAGSAPITLEANIAGGIWRGTGIIDANLGIFDPSSVVANTTYMISYLFPESTCGDSTSIEIEVVASETASIQDINLCEDSPPTILSVDATEGVWRGLGIVDSINGIFDAENLPVQQVYPVNYTFQDNNGCEVIAIGEVLIDSLPNIELPDAATLCLSDINIDLAEVLSYSFSPIGGNSLWRGNGVLDVTGSFNPVTSNLGAGDYPIVVEYNREACQVTDTILITLIEAQPLRLTTDTVVCISTEQLQLEANLVGGPWSPATAIDPSTGLINLNDIGGGNFVFNYTFQVGTSCEQSGSVEVQVIDLEATVQAGDDEQVCENSDIFVLNGFPEELGEWGGDSVNPNTGAVDINNLSAGTYNYIYEIESVLLAGCTAKDTMQLIINPLPIVDFRTEGSLCVGNVIDFINESEGATNYVWNLADLDNPTTTNTDFSFNEAGNYTIGLLAVSNTTPQCSTSFSQDIRILEPPPIVDFDMSIREGCADVMVDFTNETVGEEVSYTWNLGNDTNIDSILPGTITYTQGLWDTTYYITLTAANLCGENRNRDSIIVHPKPVARFTPIFDRYCSGEVIALPNNSYGAPDNYTWIYGNGQTSEDSIAIPVQYFTEEAVVSYDIMLIAENGCGADTLTQTIEVRPTDVNAVFNISDTIFCLNESILLEGFSTTGAEVAWNLGDGNDSSNNTLSYKYDEPGRYTITHYAYGCGFDSLSIDINIEPIPEPEFTIDGTRCALDTLSFIDITEEREASNWNFVTDTTFDLAKVEYIFETAGTYDVILTSIASNKCAASITIPIVINALPEFNILPIDSVCVNAPVQFQVDSDELYSSYAWNFGDSQFGTGRTTNHTYDINNSFNASVTVTDAFGCAEMQQAVVFVRPTPVADFIIEVLDNCVPANVVCTNLSNTANSFQWQFSNGMQFQSVDVNTLFETSGNLLAELIVGYDGICFDTLQQEFTINPIPLVEYSVSNVSCFDVNDGYIEIVDDLEYDISLTGVDSDYFQTGIDLFERLSPGLYSLDITATTGCDNMIQIHIFEPDSLFVDILQDTISINLGDIAKLDVTSNNQDITYNWFPQEGISNVTSNVFQAIPRTSTQYLLTISNLQGCIAIDSVFVDVLTDGIVYVANIFSPFANQEVNRRLFPQAGSGVEEIEVFQIFDRWGEMVYSAENFSPNDILKGWDGTFKGKLLNPDVFIFQMKIRYRDGSSEVKAGDVTLIK